jgi:hypothetical protein
MSPRDALIRETREWRTVPAKIPLDTVVVDSAERIPTDN